MSYDVIINDDISFNYTSNMSKIFHDHIEGEGGRTGLQALDGKTGAEAAQMLGDAFTALDRTHDDLASDEKVSWKDAAGQKRVETSGDVAMRDKYDAPNGWGTTLSAVIFMGRVMAACTEYPEEIIRVGS